MIASLVLVFATVTAPSSCAGPALSADEASRAAAQANALREAEAKATEDPDNGNALLEAALASARDNGEIVARDRDAHEALQYAMLALARGKLADGRKDEAAKILDRAIATAAGADLPVKLFGPSLVALHGERKKALTAEGHATLIAECTGRCIVIVDAAIVGCAATGGPFSLPMPSGTWNVLVIDADATDHRIAESVTLAASEAKTVTLAPLPVDKPPRRGPSGEETASGRKLPRWAGIVGISVGVLALVGGGVLLAVDGNCPDGTDPMGAGACQNILNTDVPGYVMLGVGVGAAVGFSVALGIGESKQKKANKPKAAAGVGPGGLRIRF